MIEFGYITLYVLLYFLIGTVFIQINLWFQENMLNLNKSTFVESRERVTLVISLVLWPFGVIVSVITAVAMFICKELE